MILTPPEIIALLESPPSAPSLQRGREHEEKHRLHIDGDPLLLDRFLRKMDLLESDEVHKQRKMVTKPDTKGLFGALGNLLDKIFVGHGTNFYFTFNSESEHEDFEEFINDKSRYGVTVKEYLESLYKKHSKTGFQGIFFINSPSIPQGEVSPEVVYLPSSAIYDIKFSAHRIEYVVIREKMPEWEQLLVVDDAAFRRYRQVDGKYTLLEEIANELAYVPACPVVTKYQSDDYVERATPYSQSLELADKMLKDSSEHEMGKLYHAFPQKWAYGADCDYYELTEKHERYECTGGYILKPDGKHKCPLCKGSGKRVPTGPDKVIVINTPTGQEINKVDIVPPTGYVVPDLTSLEYLRKEIDHSEMKIEKTVLGKEGILAITTKSETATGKKLDLSSYYDVLREYRSGLEYVVKFCLDTIARYRYTSFVDSSIKYGDKYFLTSEGELEAQYKAAKEAGAPNSVLLGYLEEIVWTKYHDDELELERNLIKLQLDPFPTLTTAELLSANFISMEDRFMSLYINDYIERFEQENGDVAVFGKLLNPRVRMARIKAIIQTYNQEKVDKSWNESERKLQTEQKYTQQRQLTP